MSDDETVKMMDLKLSSSESQDDKRTVLEVVSNKSTCWRFKFASDTLKDDIDVVKTAIKYGGLNMFYLASDRLQKMGIDVIMA